MMILLVIGLVLGCVHTAYKVEEWNDIVSWPHGLPPYIAVAAVAVATKKMIRWIKKTY